MPPRFPDEVDVFSVPHSRMRDLVRMYKSQLSTTDFNNSVDMSGFLSTLLATFKEFQQHEQIENRFIMDRLKRRLNALSVYNSAVCNCHQDNRLTEMLDMVRDGQTGLYSGRHDRHDFLYQLQQKLDEFTDNFLPHMTEEEEIFQPLLMKYFGYDELRELKQDVLQNHHLFEKVDLPEKTEREPELKAQLKPELKPVVKPVPWLPPELLTLVFCHLRPSDRAACAAVCRQWRSACLAPRLWRNLSPAAPAGGTASAQNDAIEALMLQSMTQSKLLDLDADVDECEAYDSSTPPGSPSHTAAAEQRRRLKSLMTHTLPLVGQYVQKLVLTGCPGLGSSRLRQLLVQCPNVRHLDVSYTPIGDCAFKRLPAGALQRLEHIDLSGCERLTDRSLERLAAQLELHCAPPELHCAPPPAGHSDIETAGDALPADSDSQDDCYDCESHEGCGTAAAPRAMPRDKNGRLLVPVPGGGGARLTHLLLSGCQLMTSAGVRRLAAGRALGSLRLLDVSGSWRLSGASLRALAAAAPRLDPQQLWYCDQIDDGPHPQTANGCDNVECPIRRCCRNS